MKFPLQNRLLLSLGFRIFSRIPSPSSFTICRCRTCERGFAINCGLGLSFANPDSLIKPCIYKKKLHKSKLGVWQMRINVRNSEPRQIWQTSQNSKGWHNCGNWAPLSPSQFQCWCLQLRYLSTSNTSSQISVQNHSGTCSKLIRALKAPAQTSTKV